MQVFGSCTAAAVQPAAAVKTAVRFLFGRQAEEEYEEEMRHPAADGTSDGARCCRCAVLGALLLFFHVDIRDTYGHSDIPNKNYEDETRHPSTGGTGGGAGC